MSIIHLLSACDREGAIGWLEEARSVTTVTTEMAVPKTVISRFRKVAEIGDAIR